MHEGMCVVYVCVWCGVGCVYVCSVCVCVCVCVCVLSSCVLFLYVACSSNCNTGLMECSGLTDGDCCNGVVNNACVANCTAPERPLTSANYTCSKSRQHVA